MVQDRVVRERVGRVRRVVRGRVGRVVRGRVGKVVWEGSTHVSGIRYQVFLFNLGNLSPEATVSDTQERKKGQRAK